MHEEVKKIHVLILEDSKTQAEWLKVTLEEVGMQAECIDTLAGCIAHTAAATTAVARRIRCMKSLALVKNFMGGSLCKRRQSREASN